MNIRVVDTLSRPFFARWGAAAILACAVGCAAAAPNPVSGPKSSEGYQTAAAHAILIEADSGSVLFEKAADDLIPPASLSKLMTQEVVLNEIRQGRLKPTTEFIVSTNAWRRGGAPSHTSSMFIPIHSKVSVDDLLHGAIIQSANDACIALAEGISGNESAFAELMTKRARELGLTKSTFGNSTGLPDPRQLMTSRELAKLARHIIETYPEYYKYYGEREFTWNKIRQFNRNPLLALNIGADGLKTGFTKEAGYGLVGSAVQNGLRLIVVVNGLRSEKERADEAKKMLDWGFHNFQSGLLFAQGQEIAQAKLYGGAKGHVPLTARRLFRPGAGAGTGRPEHRHSQGLARGIRCARGPAASGGKRGHRLHAWTRLRRRDRAGARPVPGGLQAAIIATASIIDARRAAKLARTA
jgi:serine-type D-Ala-D-Ala carboxypeptidase (penicillin-binding protein 5/6)